MGQKVSRFQLYSFLAKNVCELRFYRRIQYPSTSYRRMLCTNDRRLLESIPGKLRLNYRIPTGSLPYNPAKYNLVCTFDIFLQDFRMINCDECELISQIPTRDPKIFWNYFEEKLTLMTTVDKMSFMMG
jgi:hypothetical protein